MLVAQLRSRTTYVGDYRQALADLSKHLFGALDEEHQTVTYLMCLGALKKDIFDDKKRAAWVKTYNRPRPSLPAN